MALTYKFSGHESFPCKTLWLKKGYDFVANGNDFNSPDAVIALGVGKNMVASIRYWLKVFGITNPDGSISKIGDYLFSDKTGKDKYLEDLATLWLLHFNIVFLREATLYNWLFCGLQRERAQFDRNQVLTFVKLHMIETSKQNLFNENTIKKDVAVLLQNYSLPRKVSSNEDFSSILIDLELIRQNTEGKDYYFNVEGKRKVTKEVFMYGLLNLKDNDNTIAYETIHEQLGLLFCMNDAETIDMLKELAKIYPKYMIYSDVAGIRQIQFIGELDPFKVLDDYYANI